MGKEWSITSRGFSEVLLWPKPGEVVIYRYVTHRASSVGVPTLDGKKGGKLAKGARGLGRKKDKGTYKGG